MTDIILRKTSYDDFERNTARREEYIARESAINISINGSYFSSAMILPSMLEEYAAGLLFLHGIINTASDITALNITGGNIEVTTKNDTRTRETAQTVYSDLSVSINEISVCLKAILRSAVFRETEAVHSAGLFTDGKKEISITEDISRHISMDKAIGSGLLKNIDFSRTLAVSTGRQPAEMITKYLNAGIPIIATKGVPTTLAVETAVKAGITIVGLVRNGTMTVYSHPERIRQKTEK